MNDQSTQLPELNDRSREIFQQIVESYLETGEPVGSRTLTRTLSEQISAATIRNVMQDLEHLGLLDSPHISAGRLPTQLGLRMFVDGLLEVDDITATDQKKIERNLRSGDEELGTKLDRIGAVLSGMTQGASLVLTPKRDAPVKHIEFVSLAANRALVVMVFEDGHVENRVFTPPPGQTPSSMREAANYLNGHLSGKTIGDLLNTLNTTISERRTQIDSLAEDLISAGMATWQDEGKPDERLIVRGRSNLLEDAEDSENLERIKTLFDDLERKKDIAKFLELSEDAEGVRIFIGSENKLFSLSGSSLVVSPYMSSDRRIVGAIGVIGPTRLNYGRIVPIVNYTAQLVSKLVSDGG